MKLVADESVDGPIVARLRADGHDVVYIAELSPGMSDDDVLLEASSSNAILLTADKDFGELVFRLAKLSAGVILIRLAGLTNAYKAAIVSQLLQDHSTELSAAFTVVSPGAIRIRHPDAP